MILYHGHKKYVQILFLFCFVFLYNFFFIVEENLLWRARNHADARLYEKAQNHPTPSCDRLQSIYA